MSKLSWIAPHPDMMMTSTPKAIYRIVREDDEGFSLTRETANHEKVSLGMYGTKNDAKAAAEADAK